MEDSVLRAPRNDVGTTAGLILPEHRRMPQDTFVLAQDDTVTQVAPVTPAPIPEEAVEAAPPVVVELFSSQGCSFCPPADRLMGELAQQQGVIALSCHVDYFNVTKNSLGKDFCTRRQNAYSRWIGNGPRYTPQMVVNGQVDVIGYETGKINAAMMKARAAKIISIPISEGEDGAYKFTLPLTEVDGADIQLWLAVYDKPHTITIEEGANLGKKMTYTHVVSRLSDIGTWNGTELQGDVQPNLLKENEGFAIVAQDAETGQIIGAGSQEQ